MSKPLTPEELMEQLKAAGLDPSKWEGKDAKDIHPPFARKQAELLTQMRDLLNVGLESKKAEVAALQESLVRIKHGGGR